MRAPKPVALTRAQVLGYRAAVHALIQPTDRITAPVVLDTGVQDYPVGGSAHLALRARTETADRGDLAAAIQSGSLMLAHSVRGAAHLHRVGDFPLLAQALRLDDALDIAAASGGPFWADLAGAGMSPDQAMDEVAAAMRQVMADRVDRTKAELSREIQPYVDIRLRPWCPGCEAHHVQDQLFRMASLQAGLTLRRGDPSASVVFRQPDLPALPPAAGAIDRASSRRRLLRRFLRVSGVSTPTQFADWLGVTPAAARRRWSQIEDRVVPVVVGGFRGWVHEEDLDLMRGSGPPAGRVRLLPPYDPVTELAARAFLVPDTTARRRVWQASANPGVVFVDGEIAGVWWRRTRGSRLVLTVELLAPLAAGRRAGLETEAEGLANFLGLSHVTVQVE